MNKFINDKGIGLIQVTIVMAAVGTIGFFIAQNVSNQSKSMASMKFKAEAEEAMGQISSILSNRESCLNTLGTKSAISSSSFDEIRNNSNQIVINEDSMFGTQRVKIESMKLEDKPGLDDGVATVINGFGTTSLVVTFSTRQGTFFNKTKLTRKLLINVRTDSTGDVSATCFAGVYSPSSTTDDAGTIWKRQTADPDSIVYEDGNVGAQEAAPTVTFDLYGKLKVQQDGASATPIVIPPYDSMLLDSVVSNYLLNLSADKPLIFKIEAGGHANIAARIVRSTGGIILGQGGTCNASTEGAIRYGTASRRVEVCRAGVWRRKRVVRYCLAEDPDHPDDSYPAHVARYNNDEGVTLSNTIYGIEGEECGRHQVSDPDSPGGNFKGVDNNLHIVYGDPDVPKNFNQYFNRDDWDAPDPDGSGGGSRVFRFDDNGKWLNCRNTRNCRDWIPAHQ